MPRKNRNRNRNRNRRPPTLPTQTAGAGATAAVSNAAAAVLPATRHGGYVNTATGAGTSRDKSRQGWFYPSYITPAQLEVLYHESGAVRKFIDIPVDDLFIRGRVFTGDDPDAVQQMELAERSTNLIPQLIRAMKVGRLYGTGLLIPVTMEATLDTPLNVNRIRPGDLSHFLVFHCDQCHAPVIESNPYSPNYGQAAYYHIQTRYGRQLTVHYSRAIRFDGISPLTHGAYLRYGSDWGLSSLYGVLPSIMQAAGAAGDITQMVTESNFKAFKINNFDEAVSIQSANDPDVMTLEARHEANLSHINAYNMIYMGSDDDFIRIPTSFTGLPDLLDRYERTIARDADIPMTRFSGQSPIGMNSTGEGDMVNYALRVAEQQKRDLAKPLSILDQIMANHLGLPEPPPYRFASLLDLSEKTQAEIAYLKAQAIEKVAIPAMLSEDEVRRMLDGDPVFGNLEPLDTYD